MGGVNTEVLIFGGGLDGIGQNWGGKPPPPWDIYDTFPYKFFSDDKEMYGSKENFLDSKANILEIEFLAARRALKF